MALEAQQSQEAKEQNYGATLDEIGTTIEGTDSKTTNDIAKNTYLETLENNELFGKLYGGYTGAVYKLKLKDTVNVVEGDYSSFSLNKNSEYYGGKDTINGTVCDTISTRARYTPKIGMTPYNEELTDQKVINEVIPFHKTIGKQIEESFNTHLQKSIALFSEDFNNIIKEISENKDNNNENLNSIIKGMTSFKNQIMDLQGRNIEPGVYKSGSFGIKDVFTPLETIEETLKEKGFDNILENANKMEKLTRAEIFVIKDEKFVGNSFWKVAKENPKLRENAKNDTDFWNNEAKDEKFRKNAEYSSDFWSKYTAKRANK